MPELQCSVLQACYTAVTNMTGGVRGGKRKKERQTQRSTESQRGGLWRDWLKGD